MKLLSGACARRAPTPGGTARRPVCWCSGVWGWWSVESRGVNDAFRRRGLRTFKHTTESQQARNTKNPTHKTNQRNERGHPHTDTPTPTPPHTRTHLAHGALHVPPDGAAGVVQELHAHLYIGGLINGVGQSVSHLEVSGFSSSALGGVGGVVLRRGRS